MRITSKLVAAAALAVLSASSFAVSPATWTGTLTNVKIQYFPNNNGSGAGALLLTGTGSNCKWVTTPGAMILSAGSSAEGDETRNLFNFLSQAKKDGTTVSLSYDSSATLCDILSYGR